MDNKEEKIEQRLIGIIEDHTCTSHETQEQINNLIQYEIDIYENEEKVLWSDVYDKTNEKERVLFNSILADRKIRVDQKIPLADRPKFAICTIINDVCERIEFYEGHDRLEKTFDLRSKRLAKMNLEDFLTEDEYGYEPIKFLKQQNLINKENESLFRNMLEILHSSNEEELKEKVEKYIKGKN